MIVGIDAKRIVRNGTGLGSYGRTLVNDLIRLGDSDMQLRLYAPDEGRDDLRGQIIEGAEFCYPKGHPAALRKAWWRSRSIVSDLVRDGVTVYHGLSGELPMGLRKAGIRGIVTIRWTRRYTNGSSARHCVRPTTSLPSVSVRGRTFWSWAERSMPTASASSIRVLRHTIRALSRKSARRLSVSVTSCPSAMC